LKNSLVNPIYWVDYANLIIPEYFTGFLIKTKKFFTLEQKKILKRLGEQNGY